MITIDQNIYYNKLFLCDLKKILIMYGISGIQEMWYEAKGRILTIDYYSGPRKTIYLTQTMKPEDILKEIVKQGGLK